MNKLLLIVGVLTALATSGLLLAYLFVGEVARGRVLYFAVCSLGATVAILALMLAGALEAITKYMRHLEQERRRSELKTMPVKPHEEPGR